MGAVNAPLVFLFIAAISLASYTSLTLAETTGEYVLDAKQLLEQKNLRAAVIQLKNALQQSPNNAQARLLLGETYLKFNDGPAAEKELKKAGHLGADERRWKPALGEAYLLQGNANALLKDLLVDDATPPGILAELMALRGDAYLLLEQPGKARDAYEKANAGAAGNTRAKLGLARIAMSEEDTDTAKEYVNAALNQSPENITALTMSGDLQRMDKNYAQANATYQKVIDLNPYAVPALIGLAISHISAGEIGKAKVPVQNVLEKFPGSPTANYWNAVIQFEKKEFTAAESSLKKVLTVSNSNFSALLMLSMLDYRNQKYELALRNGEKMLAIEPEHPVALMLVGASYLRLKEPQKVIDLLIQHENRLQDNAQLLSLLGSAHLALGNVDKATQYLEKASEIAPEHARVSARLGVGLLASGDYDAAINTLQKSLDNPDLGLASGALIISAHLRKKDFDSAIRSAKVEAKKHPNNPIFQNFLGGAYLGKGNSKKAREAFEAALRIDSSYLSAEMNLASLDDKEGNTDAAKQRLRKVMRANPNEDRVVLTLASLEAKTGKLEQSRQLLEQRWNKNRSNVAVGVTLSKFYLASKNAEKALEVSNALLVEHPKNPAVLEALGLAQMANNKIVDAVATLETLNQQDSKRPRYTLLLAKVYQQNNQWADAQKLLEKLRKQNEDSLVVYTELAKVHLKQKDFTRAHELAELIQKQWPGKATGWAVEGEAYGGEKRFKDAANAFQVALSKEENSVLVRYYASSLAMDDRIDESINVLQGWIKKHPEEIALRIILASYFMKSGKRDLAIPHYETVLERVPNDMLVANNLAWLYTEKGDKKAIEVSAKAAQLNPENASILDTYGWALVKLGDRQKGIRVLKEARLKAPHILEISYHIAVALHEGGNVVEAKKELQSLLSKKKDFAGRVDAEALLKRL